MSPISCVEDVTNGKAFVTAEFGGEPLESVRGLALTPEVEPGCSETYGYHNHGDRWLEQRHQDD